MKQTFQDPKQLESILRSLSREKGTNRPWYETALGLERLVEHARQERWEGDADVRRLSEGATHLSWPMLARYLSVLRRMGVISTHEGVAIADLMSDGFNAVESAVRLYDRNKDDGLTALRDLKKGRQTLAGVRRSLELARGGTNGAVVAKAALLRKRSSEIREVEARLQTDGHQLFGSASRIVRRPPLRYFRQIGIEARVDGKLVGGGNILTPDVNLKHDQLDAILPTALLLANYLPAFYLIFSPAADPEAVKRTIKAVGIFKADNVGIATTGSAEFNVVLQPATRDHVPHEPGYDVLRDNLLPD